MTTAKHWYWSPNTSPEKERRNKEKEKGVHIKIDCKGYRVGELVCIGKEVYSSHTHQCESQYRSIVRVCGRVSLIGKEVYSSLTHQCESQYDDIKVTTVATVIKGQLAAHFIERYHVAAFQRVTDLVAAFDTGRHHPLLHHGQQCPYILITKIGRGALGAMV